jgi:methionine salvage enolase-phosphatase E1
MDYQEKLDAIGAKIEQCLLALSDRIAEFKASGQVGVARELERQCDQIRGKLNG